MLISTKICKALKLEVNESTIHKHSKTAVGKVTFKSNALQYSVTLKKK